MSNPLISLENVSVSLARRPVLDGLCFVLQPGESLAVLGENGAGKTTFLRLLRGDVWPDQDGRGRRLYDDGTLCRESPIGFRERFGLVTPALQEELMRLKPGIDGLTAVLTGFYDTIYLHETPGPERVARAIEVIAQTGAAALAEKPVPAMSQGQLRSILIARALAPNRLLLFLDEVFDGLDKDAKPLVSSAIEGAAASGTGIVISSHHADEIPQCVKRAVILEKGRIVWQGDRDEAVRRQNPVLSGQAPPADGPPLFAPPQSKPLGGNGEILLRIENADVYIDRKRVLEGVDWTVSRGENWAVTGANGSGKTTLCRLVMGDEYPAYGGAIGRFETRADMREIKKRIGYVANELQAGYSYDVTGEELVLSGFFASVGLYDEPDERQRETARRWMAFFGLTGLAQRTIRALSTGQLRRFLLARAMVAAPELVILDEPFSGLDQASRQAAREAVSALARQGTSIVLVTHRPEDFVPEITHVLALENGRVTGCGPAAGKEGFS